MNDTQSVVDNADSDATRSDAASDAQDDLDTLLGQFDAVDEPDATVSTGEQQIDKTKLDYIYNAQKAQEAKDDDDAMRRDISSAVVTITEGMADGTSKMAVEGMLYQGISTNPRAMKLWNNRQAEPSAWNSYIALRGKEIKKEFAPTPDDNLTSDRDAVLSAVHNASTATPTADDVDVSNMSDYQFEQHKQKLKSAERKAKA